jgi:hypothetical protein
MTQVQQNCETYDFMKQYALVLTALSDQLCYLCGNEDPIKRVPLPEHFSNGHFFQVLLAVIQHPSVYMSLYGYQIWLQLIKANVFKADDYQRILPVVLRALCHSLVKLPYTKNNVEKGKTSRKQNLTMVSPRTEAMAIVELPLSCAIARSVERKFP